MECDADWPVVVAMILFCISLPLAYVWTDGKCYRVARDDDPQGKKTLLLLVKVLMAASALLAAISAIISGLIC